jgi:hypothetical protein
MGQLDIFKATYLEGKWINATNLKPPVNSIANDFGIAFDGEYNRGFFSSDRFNGKGAEDLYSFSDDVPLEITFKNDTLEFTDKSVYDDVKYELINTVDSSNVELQLEKGWYSAQMKGKKYELNATKNGMPYNKIFLAYATDSTSKISQLTIKTTDKTILIKGYLVKSGVRAIQTEQSAETALGPVAEPEFTEILTEENGAINCKDNLQAGTVYIVKMR